MYSSAGKVTPYLEFEVKSLVMSFSPMVGQGRKKAIMMKERERPEKRVNSVY